MTESYRAMERGSGSKKRPKRVTERPAIATKRRYNKSTFRAKKKR